MPQKTEKKENTNITDKDTLTSLSGSLAAMFLQKAVEKSQLIEIPSLGIEIETKAPVKSSKTKDASVIKKNGSANEGSSSKTEKTDNDK